MALGKLLQASAILLLANVSGGVMHYLYQVIGARRLPEAEYGRLNTWLAWVTIGLAAGNVLQFVSNFRRVDARALRDLTLVSGALALAVGTALVMGMIPADPLISAIACIGVSLPFFAIVGQFQARQAFGVMGLATFTLAVAKVTVLWTPIGGEIGRFYAALPLASIVALLVMVVVVVAAPGWIRSSQSAATAPTVQLSRALPGSVTLAFAMALLPQIDLLNLAHLSDPDELGRYSRASLFAKAIFFGALTLLQISLPFHVTADRGSLSYRRALQLEQAGLAACVLGSFALAAFSPWIATRFLGFDLKGMQEWVLLSCLSLTALYGHLRRLQIRVARGAWREALTGLAAVCMITPIAWLTRPVDVPSYLKLALSCYLLIELAEFVIARLKSRSGSIARAS